MGSTCNHVHRALMLVRASSPIRLFNNPGLGNRVSTRCKKPRGIYEGFQLLWKPQSREQRKRRKSIFSLFRCRAPVPCRPSRRGYGLLRASLHATNRAVSTNRRRVLPVLHAGPRFLLLAHLYLEQDGGQVPLLPQGIHQHRQDPQHQRHRQERRHPGGMY